MSGFLQEYCITASDLIATAALLVASISALYARKANEIAARNNLRPARLEVYRLMQDFAKYCCTYPTHWRDDPIPVQGTRELLKHIDSFKRKIEQQGPLAMPTVESKIKEFRNKAWQMQRLLDRSLPAKNGSIDQNYQIIEDNLDALVDWFANEQKELITIFQSYLGEK